MFEQILDWARSHRSLLKPGAVVVALLVGGIWYFSDAPVEVGASVDSARQVVILMHGHGAAKDDLESLAEELAGSMSDTAFILPGGPHSAGVGRTWYPSFRADSQAAVDARIIELRAEARKVVADIIEDVVAVGISPSQIYVGGFSQGATVALDVLMNEPSAAELGGLISLSGGALKLETVALSTHAPLRAFVSHGRKDSVVSFSKSEAIVAALNQNPANTVEFVPFEGNHQIAPEVVTALTAFLSK